MDLGGAVKLIEAAKQEGVRRYLMVSSIGAGNPPAAGDDVFAEYLRAKAAADQALTESGLEYTIVRPGPLTDDPPRGLVRVGQDLERVEISRADVAAVLAACLDQRHTIDRSFEVVGGDIAIDAALASI
jgi:uncharacterized protein YbjT (DUF2867 family)